MNGRFGYLTVNIVCFHLIYWPLCLLAELFRARGLSKTHVLARKLIGFTYATSVISGTFGIVLTILFLKFNWYEPKWRKNVLELYRSRGFVWIGPKVLFIHVNQIFVSFIDVLVIKDRKLLAQATPPLLWISWINCYITVAYVCSIHMNRWWSDGYVPYPFLTKVLKTWKGECLFTLGVTVFNILCSLQLYYLATNEIELLNQNI